MRIVAIVIALTVMSFSAQAAEECAIQDNACLFWLLQSSTDSIAEDKWRDSAYRETAKLLVHEKRMEDALDLITKIKNPDTQALTIRGIGMAAARIGLKGKEYDSLFARLAEEAAKISHPPSHAIALTYIAMAQAFAGDNEGAMKTAAGMANAALRNKAYGETGEIQAERGDLPAVAASISAIEDADYRDKAWRTVSKIFMDKGFPEAALVAAQKPAAAYQRSQSLLYILTKKITPEEVSVE